MRKLVLPLLLLLATPALFAQKDTLTGKAAEDLMKQLSGQLFDSTAFLSQSGDKACKCIGKIKVNKKDAERIAEEISDCIHKEVESYQMMMKLVSSMSGGDKNITIYSNKESKEYKKYYYQIERWLRDTCQAMNIAVGSNNEESDYSQSRDKKAKAAYSKGIDAMKKEDYEGAADYFARAVEIDSMFAFAWDNLGVCNRKMGKLDEALYAYNKSLSIDPKGRLPLENLPIVYEFKKEYDRAIEAYKNILNYYPESAEAWYGSGRIYAFHKEDFEKALDNMCRAYNIYIKTSSPYRVDAEKIISYIYGKMKGQGKEDAFMKILKGHGISPSKN